MKFYNMILGLNNDKFFICAIILKFMKMQKGFVPIIAIFGIAMMVSIPLAFAEDASVRIPPGTSVPGCEKTNECFIPYEVTIDVSGEVTWSNEDSAAHTVTGGSAADGPSGVFDSSLFMSGTTFSHKFDTEGNFPYFCMVHPWMNGIVHVGTSSTESSPQQPELIAANPEMDPRVEVKLENKISGGKVTSMIADGNTNSIIIELDSTASGQITIILPRDVIDSKAGNNDDDFFVLVDAEESTFEETKTPSDRTVTVEFPAGTEKIEIIGTFAIPEFGTIASIILSIAIISIIGFSAKSRLKIQ
jgi:predicted secreted protein with PEFG-CTERM motif